LRLLRLLRLSRRAAAPPWQLALAKPRRPTALPQRSTGTTTGICTLLPLRTEMLPLPTVLRRPAYGRPEIQTHNVADFNHTM
jgi:hypothetical protein